MFGESIALDPASSPAANKVVQAEQFYTEEEDGLAQEWHGTVYMNPPFANAIVTKFCAKLTDAVRSGCVPAAIVLINNTTETQWFQALTREASALCFPSGRVPFWRSDRTNVDKPPIQGQCIVYLGPHPRRFCEIFAHLGVVAEIRRAV